MVFQYLVCTLPILVPLARAACTYDTVGAHFDVSPLRLSAGSSYSVRDLDDTKTRNYSYVFNICQDVHAPPSCTSLSGAFAPAYQIAADSSTCFRLGASANAMHFHLLDDTNPAKGVKLTYTDGDLCPNNVSRELHIELRCADRFSAQPGQHVIEDPCHYTLTFDSVFGCPLECGSSNRLLCSGHGLCQYDSDMRSAKCFCDRGFSGSDCSEVGEAVDVDAQHCSRYCKWLIAIAALLLLGVVGVVMLNIRVQRLTDAANQFQALRSTFNFEDDSGSVNGIPPGSDGASIMAPSLVQAMDGVDDYDDDLAPDDELGRDARGSSQKKASKKHRNAIAVPMMKVGASSPLAVQL